MIIGQYIPIPARQGAEATSLYIKIVAEDKPSLSEKPYAFVLPGGPGASHLHYQDYTCLKHVVNVVFYDPRGCGASARGMPESYTMDNYIKDLDVVRQALKLKKIQLVGKSYGAMCALGYVIRFPHVVTHMVVAAGSPSFRNITSAKEYIAQHGNALQQAMCHKLFEGTFESEAEVLRYLDVMLPFYSYKKKHKLPMQKRKQNHPFNFEALNLGFRTFLRSFDFESLLSNIGCKTLVLVGEDDWITQKKHAIVIANHIPGAQLLVFERASHALEEDVPQLFFDKVSCFLRG